MSNMKDSKVIPSNSTGTKDNHTESLKDYKYSPRVENPNPKATTDKRPSSGNIKGV